MSKRTKIIIAEHSPMIAEGLKTFLDASYEFDVVAIADCMERVQERLLKHKSCLLIINPNFFEYNKRLMLKSIFQEYPDVIFVALLTTYVEQSVLRQYHGVIEIADNRQRAESKLRDIIQNTQPTSESKENSCELSDREIDVLIAVAKGLLNREIAKNLNISVHTVISHRKNITRKTGIKSVSGLTIYALLNNLIDSSEVI
ncbi:MAG: response regulator transcription factor [Bacteroidales bacterium]|jgi:DNA-binding NarL/FixJ family response regulator|nr:response regulator transcription factor [Bacteroidales bacterium]